MPYSGSPATSTRDHTRFLLGDTSASPKLSDAEIDWLLLTYTTPVLAAFHGAKALRDRFAHLAAVRVGPTQVEYAQLYDQYQQLVKDLAAAAGVSHVPVGPPTAGGVDDRFRMDIESPKETGWEA